MSLQKILKLLVKNLNPKFLQLINGDARISRADISAVLGENDDPNFWPSRGRRNSPEPKFKQYLERKYNMNTLNGKTNMLGIIEF